MRPPRHLAPAEGTRIRLILMPDDPDPILPGTTGTVTGSCDSPGGTQIWVRWDSGRTLSLEVPPDIYETIKAKVT